MGDESPVRSWSYELSNTFPKEEQDFQNSLYFFQGYCTRLRWEEQVVKESMFDIETWNVSDIISCPVCCLSGGVLINEILKGLIFSYL